MIESDFDVLGLKYLALEISFFVDSRAE